MEFRVLGPLEVWDGGQQIALARAKQRTLLAVLVLKHGQVVTSDRLVDELWGEEPPRSAANSLQNLVMQLRRSLGSEVLRTRESGYLLDVDAEQVDATRFERLVSDGGAHAAPAAKAERLRAALSLWRGPVCRDSREAQLVRTEAARLEELRVSVTEDAIEAELALGRDAQLVPELEALVAEHPFRERLRRQLMLALYRAERQADSLAVYREARRLLADELGLEPSEELQRLERAVLAHDPSLDAAPPARPPPAPDRTVAPAQSVPLVRKTVTVVFADVVVESDGGERLDPEAARALLARWRGAMSAVLARHSATVDDVAGDELMAVFGVPVAHEDDALRAVRAALDMREAFADLDAELAGAGARRLEMRTGIDSGEVVAGEGSVTGEVVTAARRLRQDARPGEIFVGAGTMALAGESIDADRVDATTPSVRLSGVASPPVPPDRGSPFVGRTGELKRLLDAFDDVRERRVCQMAPLLGDAGIGKSRLAREFVTALDDTATVLVGRCVSYGEGATYVPVAEMLRQALGDHPEDALRELLGDDVDRDAVGERIADLVGRSSAGGGSGDVFWAIRKLFEALARDRPLVVVVEDVHWAEPTLLDLVEYLAAWSNSAPVLLLCPGRPDVLERRPAWSASAVTLEPLPDGAVNDVLDARAGADLSTAARDAITTAAEGNPLFVEQLLAFVREGGDPHDLPPSVNALLAGRLDRVEPAEREILHAAAVVGREFWRGAILELVPEVGPETVDAGLLALVRKGLLEAAPSRLAREDGLRFQHVLIRDAAYASVPKADRAGLHRGCARWLGERDGSQDELVGYHLEQAYRCRAALGPDDDEARMWAAEASARLAAAGSRAASRGDVPAAVNLLRRALELLDETERTAELLSALGEALYQIGEIGSAVDALAAAVERAASAQDRETEVQARMLHADFRMQAGGSVEDASATLAESIRVSEELDDHRSLSRTWRLSADLANFTGLYDASCKNIERALVHARLAGDDDVVLNCRSAIGWMLFWGSAAVTAGVTYWEAFIHEDARGRPYPTEWGLRALSKLRAMQGRFDEARVYGSESLAILRQLGRRQRLAGAADVFGMIEMLDGHPDAAEEALRRGVDELADMGSKGELSTMAALLAEAILAQGRLDEAEHFTRVSEDVGRRDDVVNEIAWRRVRAQIHARRGIEGATSLAREAARLSLTTDALDQQAAAHASLADVLRLVGERDEAETMLRTALALYERKGNVAAAARLRASWQAPVVTT